MLGPTNRLVLAAVSWTSPSTLRSLPLVSRSMPPESVSATIVSLALAMLTSLGVLKIASSLESGSSAGVQLAFDASQFALPPIQVIGAAAACSVKPMARVIAAISPSPLRDFEMPLYQGSMIFEMKFIPLTL